MTNAEFLALEKGAEVIYNGTLDSLYGIEKGVVLTRSESWMDDDHTISFSYVTSGGSQLEHFFSVREIETKE